MAFEVQSPTVPTPEANAYEDVAFVRDYHSDRGLSLEQYLDPAVRAAIVVATQYLDVRFGPVFKGEPLLDDQSTEWPRRYACDARGRAVDGIPTAVKQAMAEYAYRVLLSGPTSLMPDPEVDGSGLQVKSREETVGPITEKVEYATGTGSVAIPTYPYADRLLASRGLLTVDLDPGALSSGNLARG